MERRNGAGPWWSRAAACCVALLACGGCVAQQADLVTLDKTLSAKIAKLDKQEKELQQAIKQAKGDFEKIVGETRARLNQDITVLRDADLPSMHGGIEQATHQITMLRHRVEDLEHQSKGGLDGMTKRLAAIEKAQADDAEAARADREKIATRLDAMGAALGTVGKTAGGRLEEHDKSLVKLEAENAKLAQQVEQQQRASAEQMAQYAKALADFKKALGAVGEQVTQEQGRSGAVSSKVENDLKTMSAHLNEVTKSVGSVAKALETVGSQLLARVDEQDRQIQELSRMVKVLEAQVRDSQGTPAAGPRAESAPPAAAAEAPKSAPAEAFVARAETSTQLMREASTATVKESYENHLAKFRRGDLDGALRGFQDFLKQHPRSELAGNAQYWLAESYYGKHDYDRAIEAYDRVKLHYPASEKVPAALLKKGFAYLAMKDPNRASSVWRQVVDGYPNTPEAEKAMEKLGQLKQIR